MTLRTVKILRLSSLALALALALIIVPKGSLSADSLFSESLLDLVSKTPEVVEARQNLELSDAEIELLTNQTKPKVNFSSDGNYPITTNLASSNKRISNADERYIDGKISWNTKLYDFGAQDELIRSESFKKSASAINVEIIEQDTYYNLLKTGFEIISFEKQVQLISSHIILHNQDRAIINQRFIQGVGTNIDVKESELVALNLQSEYVRLKSELFGRKTYFFDKFGAAFDTHKASLVRLYDSIIEPKIDFDADKLLIIRKINYELRALDAEVSSITKSKLPVVTSFFTLNMYNMNSSVVNDYSITGGVNMSLPLYDAGVNKSKTRKIIAKRKILKTRILKETSVKHQKWSQNSADILRVKDQARLLSKKQIEAARKYEMLESLSTTLQANLMETIQAKVSLRKHEQEQTQLEGELQKAYLENVYLRGQLLEGRLE